MSSASISTKKRTARRCLFGRSDSQATNQWLSEKINENMIRFQKEYGFDILKDCPIPGTSDYEYYPMIATSVPEFYRSKFISSPSNMNTPTKENDCLNTSTGSVISSSSSSDESDMSMDYTLSPIEPAKRTCATPKKRQGKVTDMFQVQRKKRLQRSPKTVDIVLPARRTSIEARI